MYKCRNVESSPSTLSSWEQLLLHSSNEVNTNVYLHTSPNFLTVGALQKLQLGHLISLQIFQTLKWLSALDLRVAACQLWSPLVVGGHERLLRLLRHSWRTKQYSGYINKKHNIQQYTTLSHTTWVAMVKTFHTSSLWSFWLWITCLDSPSHSHLPCHVTVSPPP